MKTVFTLDRLSNKVLVYRDGKLRTYKGGKRRFLLVHQAAQSTGAQTSFGYGTTGYQK